MILNPEIPFDAKQCVKLLTAMLLRAIEDAKARHLDAAKWLAEAIRIHKAIKAGAWKIRPAKRTKQSSIISAVLLQGLSKDYLTGSKSEKVNQMKPSGR